MLSFKRLSIATCGNSAAPNISGGREEALHKAWGKNHSLGGEHMAELYTQNQGAGECRVI